MKKLIVVLCLVMLGVFPAVARDLEGNEGAWYRLHLGTGVGDKAVSTELLRRFVDKEITPRFPAGLTATDGRGQWKSDEYGVIRERTIIIDIYCPDTEDSAQKVEAIAKAYVEKFKAAKASLYVVRVPGISAKIYY